ncbi:MAG: Hsp20/alpha crystallin family protein, partial [Halobacteriales archaeon]|nr:Hsp20/alpha crystallin family protein [Halobacteriales archaeon]
MALPATPTNRWFRELDRPFRLLGDSYDWWDDYQLYEEDDEFVLNVDMPGFERDEIHVAWDDGVLNISADHVDQDRGQEKTYHRRFRFPKHVEEDEIAARYNNG